MKPLRGGRRFNTANHVVKKLNVFKTIAVKSLPNEFIVSLGEESGKKTRTN